MDDTQKMLLILAALSGEEMMTAREVAQVCRQVSVTDAARLLMQMKRHGYVTSSADPLRYAITPGGRKRLRD